VVSELSRRWLSLSDLSDGQLVSRLRMLASDTPVQAVGCLLDAIQARLPREPGARREPVGQRGRSRTAEVQRERLEARGDKVEAAVIHERLPRQALRGHQRSSTAIEAG